MNLIGIPAILLGIVLLVFGRRLFWLLLGTAGFLLGWYLSSHLVETASETASLVAAFIMGAAGALLAVFAQKIAIAVGGFIVGGYVMMTVFHNAALLSGLPDWAPFLLGGIAGAVLLRWVFEWTLIVLTSFVGAILVLQGVAFEGNVVLPLTLLLTAIGIVIQVRSKKRST